MIQRGQKEALVFVRLPNGAGDAMTDEHVAVLRIAAARLFAELGDRELNGTLGPVAAGHRDRLGEVIAFLSQGAVASLAMDRLNEFAALSH